MNTEKLSLQWNDFQQNISTAFGALKDDPDFSDVTLVCEDGQQLEAHRIILAASSPFFQNMLRKNKQPNPLIYMKGVKSVDLVALIDFLYCGEVQVLRDNLENFMAMAEELKIKGLWKEKEEEYSKDQNIVWEQSGERSSKKKIKTKLDNKIEDNTNFKESFRDYEPNATLIEDDVLKDVKVNLEEYEPDLKLEANDQHKLMELIKSKIGPGQTMGVKQRNNVCKVCGKEGTWSLIKTHIESQHTTGLLRPQAPCTKCEKVYKNRRVLYKHTRLAHSMM